MRLQVSLGVTPLHKATSSDLGASVDKTGSLAKACYAEYTQPCGDSDKLGVTAACNGGLRDFSTCKVECLPECDSEDSEYEWLSWGF